MTDPTDPASSGAASPWRRATASVRGARRQLRARRRLAAVDLPSLAARERVLELPQGPLALRELGEGPRLLFVHGLLVDGHVFDALAAELVDRFRCVLPDLPLGAHRLAQPPGSDLTPEGVAGRLQSLVDALGDEPVTVVASDSGVAITQHWMDAGMRGVQRVVLLPGDCFERFLPPGFSLYQRIARVPRLLDVALQTTRLAAVRRLPLAYGGLTFRRVPDALSRAWVDPVLGDPAVRRDVAAFLRGIDHHRLTAAEGRLGEVDLPVLLAWSQEQRWFPIEHAHRLARILPRAELRLIHDSGAFVQLDQPAATAAEIAAFVERWPAASGTAGGADSAVGVGPSGGGPR